MSAAALRLRADDRLLVGLPLFHVGGAITCTFAALSAGATVIFCGLLGARDPDLVGGIWGVLQDTRATVLAMVPTSLGAAVEAPSEGIELSRLRGIVTGASAISPALATRLEAKVGVPVCQVFGMTELSGICTAQPLDGRRRTPAVGYPAPLLRLALAGEGASESGGEVLLQGPNVFLGYLTRDGVQGGPGTGPVPSGDLGQIGPDGQLRLLGRRKDVIIRGGHNIDPLMIEDVACAFPGVAQAAAVGMPDAYAGEVPVLYVSLQAGARFVLADLEAHLRAQIAEPPARPRQITVVDALPLTPVGKVARFQLRQAAAEQAARVALQGLPVERIACRDSAAKAIAVGWRAEATPTDQAAAADRLTALGLRPI